MGKTIAFTGSRPSKLCGYDRAKYDDFVHWLKQYILSLYDNGFTKFISGGAQGFDQLAFWAVNLAKAVHPDIENILYLPFPRQEHLWSKEGLFSKSEYKLIKRYADNIIFCSNLDPTSASKAQVSKELYNRNHCMVNDADEIIALYPDDTWMNNNGGTAECMRYTRIYKKPINQLYYKIDSNGLSINEIKRLTWDN